MKRIEYLKSITTFYQKGYVESDSNLLKIQDPINILTIIPAGYKKDVIPLNHIASVQRETQINGKYLFGGFIILLLSIYTCETSLLNGILMLILACSMIINCCQNILMIALTSGEKKKLHFVIYQLKKAKNAENMILSEVTVRMNDTNFRQQTDRTIVATNQQTQAIVDAIQTPNR